MQYNFSKRNERLKKMEITNTRTYRFTTAELNAIETCCQIAEFISATEKIDNDNEHYSFETFFNAKYEEFINNGECNPTFSVSVDD